MVIQYGAWGRPKSIFLSEILGLLLKIWQCYLNMIQIGANSMKKTFGDSRFPQNFFLYIYELQVE